jgi:hypothetical protein
MTEKSKKTQLQKRIKSIKENVKFNTYARRTKNTYTQFKLALIVLSY